MKTPPARPTSPGPGLRRLCFATTLVLLTSAARAEDRETFQVRCGELQATLVLTSEGIRLDGLRDLRTQSPLLASNRPIFTLVASNILTRVTRTLSATEGWSRVGIGKSADGLDLDWREASEPALEGLAIRARVTRDPENEALRWTLKVDNRSKSWTLRRVVFPEVEVVDLGERGAVFFPRGPGEIQRDLWRRDFRYRGNYPDGWCAMQFLAAYREDETPTGLYLGIHDPWGSTKHLEVASIPSKRAVRLAFEVPASNPHLPGNDFDLAGEAVWQLLRGDWFDAATTYRGWAMRHARWWPRLGPDGRRDTPAWMRELPAWVMTGGSPADCVPAVKTFRESIGLPIGFHWYNWHQIPFDNDYPHYFPAKPGFAEGVADLRRAGVHTMPYINGRLWDSHDRGHEDAEFGSIALPATTKKENGEPYLESYGSMETNGQPVRLGVMCPTTRLWQERVREIVLRLQVEEGVHGVYIDQIAAAAPTLCMDPRHGHPLGGGHWWTRGYWKLLGGLRRQMPADHMLTTECNAEPFIRWFDGYLTWHWQHDGQVPAFPAVYGGTIQMFGRAYRGGDTRHLAFRMKSGQQLVYGEQIGWFDPRQAGESNNLDFVRQVIRTRWNHRRYFHAGEMARPPRLTGAIPVVKADWQWSGEWPVTTDAVLTGAWRLPAEQRVLLLFVNVGDTPVSTRLRLVPERYGLVGSTFARWLSESGSTPSPGPSIDLPFDEAVELPPRTVRTWELLDAGLPPRDESRRH